MKDEIGIISSENLKNKVRPGFIQKVANAAKTVLESQVPFNDVDLNSQGYTDNNLNELIS